ncbi:unnamed protein product, partial [Symbiodinium sp. KB8]
RGGHGRCLGRGGASTARRSCDVPQQGRRETNDHAEVSHPLGEMFDPLQARRGAAPHPRAAFSSEGRDLLGRRRLLGAGRTASLPADDPWPGLDLREVQDGPLETRSGSAHDAQGPGE